MAHRRCGSPAGSLPQPLWQCGDVAATERPDTGEHHLPDPVHVFPFDFSDVASVASRLVGVWPMSSGVSVSAHDVSIRFGPWELTTPVENVRSATVTRHLPLLAAGGPPRIDPRTKALTLATSTQRGVKLRFVEPVRGGLPTDRVRHPEVTVTVRDPEGLVSLLDTLHRPG